jgi:hypothetical protein
MAADPRKRQKKLQRRAAKSKEKRHALDREKTAGLAGQFAAAAKFPVVECLVAEELFETGIGPVNFARETVNGSVAFASFLVDRYCLGVKNAMIGVVSRFEYESNIRDEMAEQCDFRKITPATARRFVEDAVEFARKLGFPPHRDYARARLLFGSIDPAEATEILECGRDGKPVFIRGPFESSARTARILMTLEQACGPDGFSYTLPMEGPGGFLGISDESDQDDDEENEYEWK